MSSSETVFASDEMSRQALTLIVAATPKNGIGKNNGLPWPMLKKEMAYFARVTKHVPSNRTGRNAVIMGRKTWDSIPTKFRPLKDRTNIVISSQSRSALGDIPSDVIVASSIMSGLQSLQIEAEHGRLPPLGRAFVIGGTSVYKTALDLPQTDSILLTRVHKDFDCDTHFPDIDDDGSGWRKQTPASLSAFVGEDIPPEPLSEGEGNDKISFSFHLYQKSESKTVESKGR